MKLLLDLLGWVNPRVHKPFRKEVRRLQRNSAKRTIKRWFTW